MALIPTTGTAELMRVHAQATDGRVQMLAYHWNPDTLAYEVATAHSSGVGEEVVVTNAVAVTGPLTDAQLRAAVVPVSVSNFPATQPVSGTVTANTGLTQPLTDAQLRASAVPVSAAALPLPTGAATGTKQDTGNTSVASIDTKTPALGQALAAASVPVVLTAVQQAALTPPSNTGYALDGTDISAPTAMPAGGVGIRGWLSAIWTKLNGSLVVTQATPANLQATVVGADTTLGATVTPKAASVWDISDRLARVLGVVTMANMDVALSTRLKPADTLAGVTTVAAVTTITNALPAGANLIGQAALPSATLVVTALSVANTTVTCTLPAVAGQFHYISRIIIERVATTAVVGSAALTYTSTNLPGSWARTTGNAAPVGQQLKDVDEVLGCELKSLVANTATTIVAPGAGATALVRITVYYRAAT